MAMPRPSMSRSARCRTSSRRKRARNSRLPPRHRPGLGSCSLPPAKSTAGAGDQGVVVTAVDPNGPAAEQGIKTGDVIVNVGGTSVSTPADVQKELGQLQKAGKHSVLMRGKSG